MIRQLLTEQLRAATGFDTSVISDSELSSLISAALAEYAHYRPSIRLTAEQDAIETVEGQAFYDPPSEAIWIIEVFYDPDASCEALVRKALAEAMVGERGSPADLYALDRSLTAFREFGRQFGRGSWRTINGKIWLSPTPERSGDKVAVLYACALTLEDLNEVRDQKFVDLVKGYMYERRANDLQASSGWRAGSYSVAASVGESMFRVAQQQLERARAIIASSYYAERSGPGRLVSAGGDRD